MPTEQELIEKAIRHYIRACEASGAMPQQPSSGSYVDDDGVVVLENVRGTLARLKPVVDARDRVTFVAIE